MPSRLPTRVLIVDQDPDSRWLLRAVLGTDGGFAIVGEASDQFDAEGLIAVRAPDLIVLEVELPIERGLAAVARFRAMAPNARLVVYTVRFDAVAHQAARAAGADLVLHKTVVGQRLIRNLIR